MSLRTCFLRLECVRKSLQPIEKGFLLRTGEAVAPTCVVLIVAVNRLNISGPQEGVCNWCGHLGGRWVGKWGYYHHVRLSGPRKKFH